MIVKNNLTVTDNDDDDGLAAADEKLDAEIDRVGRTLINSGEIEEQDWTIPIIRKAVYQIVGIARQKEIMKHGDFLSRKAAKSHSMALNRKAVKTYTLANAIPLDDSIIDTNINTLITRMIYLKQCGVSLDSYFNPSYVIIFDPWCIVIDAEHQEIYDVLTAINTDYLQKNTTVKNGTRTGFAAETGEVPTNLINKLRYNDKKLNSWYNRYVGHSIAFDPVDQDGNYDYTAAENEMDEELKYDVSITDSIPKSRLDKNYRSKNKIIADKER